jgi:hypothetical protein
VPIPTDNVGPQQTANPRPWNIGEIGKFIVFIGPISSIFARLLSGAAARVESELSSPVRSAFDVAGALSPTIKAPQLGFLREPRVNVFEAESGAGLITMNS